jgi:hypothetical protein
MPFDGREEVYTTLAPQRKAEGWRNLYSHPTAGSAFGENVWPTEEAALEAVRKARNNGHTHWVMANGHTVLKSETSDVQVPYYA